MKMPLPPTEHPTGSISLPTPGLARKLKSNKAHPLLALSITRRLALGFLFPMLAIFAGFGSIGLQSNQLLTHVSNFNQHLLNASTTLTGGVSTLEQIHTNLQGAINDASKSQMVTATLNEDQLVIQNLVTNYDLTLKSYLRLDDLNVHPELAVLLTRSGHSVQLQTLHQQGQEALTSWKTYQRTINDNFNTLMDIHVKSQPLDIYQGEQAYADAITSLLTLIHTINGMGTAIQDATAIEENQLLLVMGLAALCLLLGCAFMGWLISATLVKRLWRFRATAQAVEQGQFEARLEVVGRDEIALVAQAVNTSFDTITGLLEETRQQRDELVKGQELKRLHAVVQEEKEALQKANRRLEALATTDMLTSLPNHRGLQILLQSENERAQRFHHPYSILFFDGDRFKLVNDTYGHSVGDAVLRELGQRAQSVMRAGDTIGRFGGEEFLVMLPETDLREGWQVAERLRNAIAATPMATQEVKGGIAITISIGLASYPHDGLNANEVRERADQSMYWAKRLGRNQIRTSDEAIRAERDATLKAATAHALERKELHELATRQGDISNTIIRMEQLELIYSLMGVLDVREPGMSEHAHEVSDLVSGIARMLNFKPERIFQASTAAFLHDIGKIALPDQLLQKPGHEFSEPEWRLMHQHAELGADIVEASSWLSDLAPAIRYHHERWDGKGTPEGLKGEEIPLEARMITLAEAYHAMISDKPYRTGLPRSEVLNELKLRAGTQFDPTLVPILITVLGNRLEGESTIWERTHSSRLSQV